MKIKKAPRTTNGLTFPELGLLTYMLNNVDSDGNFQQPLSIAAETGSIAPSTVHKYQKALIKKGAVAVVQKSRKGASGYLIPPVLKPNPIREREQAFSQNREQAQTTDNKMQSLFTDKDIKPIHETAKAYSRVNDKANSNTEGIVLSGREVSSSSRKVDEKNLQNRFDDATPFLVRPPAFELYRPGARGIPSAEFDQRRIPMCPECNLQTCDFFPHKDIVDIELFCDEDCYEASRERRVAEASAKGEEQ